MKFLVALLVACGSMFTVIPAAVAADTYPTRTIRWIVPYPPGGTTDILARIMGQWLSERLGQQVLIDNRPGAGNNIGTELAIKSTPDGYTVFLVNPANAINATLYTKLPFNFLNDMAPVGGMVRVPNVMEVTNSLPAKSIPEFIAYAKANPGKVILASSGAGTSVHLSGELFMSMTGIKMTHVPYKGAGPAFPDLIGGQVHVMFDNMPSSIEFIRGGKLRA
jgi:tripartite-type tricarboxylate transporter receptor subunit TctC